MILPRFLVASLLLSTACTRPGPSSEPVQPAREATTEPEVSKVDVRRLVLGWPGMATLTERGVVGFRGFDGFDAWLVEQGPVEDIWLANGICVRTASGVSCRGLDEFRLELPTDAPVIDLERSFKSACAATSDGGLWCSIGNYRDQDPLRRFPVSGARDIEIHEEFGCARREDRSAQCWMGKRLSLTEFCKRDPSVLGCEALGSGQEHWPGPSDSFSNTRDIAVGFHFACVLDEGGTPLCYDEWAEYVAPPDATDKFVAIEGVPPLVEIDAGLRHVCGRSEAGEVWCWGSNQYGQLGDGTTQSHEAVTPVRVGSFPALDQLALDNNASCMLADGQVHCWGHMADTPIDPIPSEIPGVLASALEVGVGESSACALVGTGWKCWGGGSSGTPGGAVAASQIVDDTRTEEFGNGCRLRDGHLSCVDDDETWLDLRGVVDVVRTSDPMCVLRHERVECHENGQPPLVVRVPAAISIRGDSDYGCVLTKTGAVHCFTGDSPAARIELPGKQVALSAGSDGDACALDETGSVRCWAVDLPVLDAEVSDIVELHGGIGFGCARNRAGAIACWGEAVADSHPTPDLPAWLELPAPAVEFGLGVEHGCARIDDGRVFCWGSEESGERARLSAEYVTRPKLITMD